MAIVGIDEDRMRATSFSPTIKSAKRVNTNSDVSDSLNELEKL